MGPSQLMCAFDAKAWTRLVGLSKTCTSQSSRMWVQGATHAPHIQQELAKAVAAAVYAKQIPLQDLLGFFSFAVPAGWPGCAREQTSSSKVLAKMVIEAFVDTPGMPA